MQDGETLARCGFKGTRLEVDVTDAAAPAAGTPDAGNEGAEMVIDEPAPDSQ